MPSILKNGCVESSLSRKRKRSTRTPKLLAFLSDAVPLGFGWLPFPIATPPLNEKYGVPLGSSTQPISSRMMNTTFANTSCMPSGIFSPSSEKLPSFQPRSLITTLSGLPVSDVILKIDELLEPLEEPLVEPLFGASPIMRSPSSSKLSLNAMPFPSRPTETPNLNPTRPTCLSAIVNLSGVVAGSSTIPAVNVHSSSIPIVGPSFWPELVWKISSAWNMTCGWSAGSMALTSPV